MNHSVLLSSKIPTITVCIYMSTYFWFYIYIHVQYTYYLADVASRKLALIAIYDLCLLYFMSSYLWCVITPNGIVNFLCILTFIQKIFSICKWYICMFIYLFIGLFSFRKYYFVSSNRLILWMKKKKKEMS